MKKSFKLSKEKDTKFKKRAVRNAVINYYKTVNQGKLSIPSFILADFAIRRVRAFERLDELYDKLVS